MNFLRRVFGLAKDKKQMTTTHFEPAAPAEWNLTISDLMREMKEGKRKSVGSPEVDWARDYERSLIPADMRFPKKGDVYEVISDMHIQYMTAWAAPFTGGGEAVIKEDERIFIYSEPNSPKPISVYGMDLHYTDLEKEIIPSSDLSAPKYNGYYFFLKTVDLNTKFRLVEVDRENENGA